MKNFFLLLCALYGIAVSSVSLYGLFCIDLPALEYAVLHGSERAESRHRLNVAAEGNWALLGNIITVISIAGLKKKD